MYNNYYKLKCNYYKLKCNYYKLKCNYFYYSAGTMSMNSISLFGSKIPPGGGPYLSTYNKYLISIVAEASTLNHDS